MKKFLAAAVFGVCLLSPVASFAQDHHDPMKHEWNDGENESWHRFLKERHRKDHEWVKASKSERAAYWKWRDQHR